MTSAAPSRLQNAVKNVSVRSRSAIHNAAIDAVIATTTESVKNEGS